MVVYNRPDAQCNPSKPVGGTTFLVLGSSSLHSVIQHSLPLLLSTGRQDAVRRASGCTMKANPRCGCISTKVGLQWVSGIRYEEIDPDSPQARYALCKPSQAQSRGIRTICITRTAVDARATVAVHSRSWFASTTGFSPKSFLDEAHRQGKIRKYRTSGPRCSQENDAITTDTS